MRLYSRLVLVPLLLIAGMALSCSTEKNESPAEPEAMNDTTAVEQATFVDLDGDEVALSDFRGKVVLIDFWETWCRPCLASFPTMQQLMEDHPETFVVLAVTPGFTDTPEDARSFAAEHEYDFVYLYDEYKLHEKLNVQGIPFKVFVDEEGTFVEMSLGTRGPKGDYEHAREIIMRHPAEADSISAGLDVDMDMDMDERSPDVLEN